MSEIEKTIEELEAEVLSELEEQADAPKKGAAPAEPQLKASDASSVTPGGEVVAVSYTHLRAHET